MKYRYIAPLFMLLTSPGRAQFTLGGGGHVLEVTGFISTFYNQRFLKPGETDRSKDRFALRDAQVSLEGRYRRQFEYRLQFDLADMASGGGVPDPENPGLMDANVTWKCGGPFDLTFGYMKVPYGRSSAVPFANMPYWQRAEIARGDVFSRRDAGAMLTATFMRQLAKVEAGVFTGLGEQALRGDNDAGGRPEFIVRAEMAWPSRFRKRDVDDRISPVPMVVLGGNARHADKRQPAGALLPAQAAGPYDIKVIDGTRTGIGGDVAVQFRGLSAQFEVHRLRYTPRNTASALFQATTPEQNGGYFMAGGYYGQLSWFDRRWNTILSVRYEELQLNDLSPGSMRRVCAAAAYQLKGGDAMVKAQYWHTLSEERDLSPLEWTDQVRIGFQYAFN